MKMVKKILGRLILATMVGAVLAYAMVKAPLMHQNWIIDKTAKNVIKLTPPSNHKRGGTGFQVLSDSGNKYILSNRHVCLLAEANEMHAITEDGRATIVRVLEISTITDLCLLTPIPNKPGVKLAKSLELRSEVAVIGHPFLMEITFTKGLLLNYENVEIPMFGLDEKKCKEFNGQIKEIPVFFTITMPACVLSINSVRTTAQTYGGNSGSPVVNFYGNLVGVLFAGYTGTIFGYIVPLVDVKEFLKNY